MRHIGSLPTHAGIVWTDVGRNGGGTPRPEDLVENTIFEAFGPDGALLGTIGPVSLGDEFIDGQTAEDRFFGVISEAGISSIRLSMPGLNNWSADHLQYGYKNLMADNQPPTIADLSVSPGAVDEGTAALVTLTATGLADVDGTVDRVDFFFLGDSGFPMPGELIGSAVPVDGVATLQVNAPPQLGFFIYEAVPVDDDGAVGEGETAGLSVLAVEPQPPTIGGLFATPNPAEVGSPITLTLTGVTDPDDDVTRVEFYLEDNTSNFRFIAGVDEDGSDGWSLETTAPDDFFGFGDTDGFNGFRDFTAIAFDSVGLESNKSTTRLNVFVDDLPPPSDDLAFTFLNAGDDVRLFQIEDGATYQRSELASNLSVEVDNVDAEAESVAWTLVGPGGLFYENTENISFYTLFRNEGMAYEGSVDVLGSQLPAGMYTLTATSYLADNALGGTDETGSVTFTIADDAATPTVDGLFVFDADSNTSAFELTDGGSFNAGDVPANATIVANASGGTESVAFLLTGPGGLSVSSVENVAPYSIFANDGDDYFGDALPVGDYSLSVTPYSQDNASGTAGSTIVLSFSIFEQLA